MSVIVRDENDQILLLCKGADRSDSFATVLCLLGATFCVFWATTFKISSLLFKEFLCYSIIFDRLANGGKEYLDVTTKHLNDYGEAGLRTLAIAYKKLDEAEYNAWNDEFNRAKTSFGSDREANLERVSDMMERDLILVGATAVEDKLQKGVCHSITCQCLCSLHCNFGTLFTYSLSFLYRCLSA